MSLLLELNDAALTLHRNGEAVYQMPAVALMEERRIIFGQAALARARMQPRQVNQHYLARMNADPLPTRSRLARSHADLVYLHLQELVQHVDAPLIIATPAVYSTDQLGILLGILEQATLRVAGFVDSAVAAASLVPVSGSAWHLDVLLQRAVLTRLDLEGEQLSRAGVEEFTECGLARLVDNAVNAVAGHFVRETRFDPLHAAATEQQLYDQIFKVMTAGSEPEPVREPALELAFEIRQGTQTRRVDLQGTVLDSAVAQRLGAIAGRLPRGSHLLLSARAARLPGLATTLERSGLRLERLPNDALVLGCDQHRLLIARPEEDPRLITRLPGRVTQDVSAPNDTYPATPTDRPLSQATLADPHLHSPPTHLLLRHRALPFAHADLPVTILSHGPITLLRAGPGITLNGRDLERDTTLEVGDRVGFPGGEGTVIGVEH
ncbi:MAG: hypothetical protein ACO3Z6_06100 [Pseudomonadales bacterium]